MKISIKSVVAVLSALLLVAGCGDNDDNNGTDDETQDVVEDTTTNPDTGDDEMDTGVDAGDTDDGEMDAGTDADEEGDTSDAQGDTTQTTTATVQELRSAASSLGDGESLSNPYRVEDVVVTAASTSGNRGFFIQEQNADDPANSGLWVYMGDSSESVPAKGDVVTVTGTVMNFSGVIELANPSTVTTTGTADVPTPVSVTPQEVMTGGSRAGELRGVLVEVSNVTVITANPDETDYNEFVVGASSSATEGVRVDDYIFSYGDESIDPAEGDTFTTVRGPLHFTHGNTKIVPRSADDLVE